jgi:chromosome segregation ATPase
MTRDQERELLHILHRLDDRSARVMRVLFILGAHMSEIDDQLAAELAAEQQTDADVQAQGAALAAEDADIQRLIRDFEAAGPLTNDQRAAFAQLAQAIADRGTAARTATADIQAQTAAIDAADAQPAPEPTP